MWLYPNVIQPLFNEFRQLQDCRAPGPSVFPVSKSRQVTGPIAEREDRGLGRRGPVARCQPSRARGQDGRGASMGGLQVQFPLTKLFEVDGSKRPALSFQCNSACLCCGMATSGQIWSQQRILLWLLEVRRLLPYTAEAVLSQACQAGVFQAGTSESSFSTPCACLSVSACSASSTEIMVCAGSAGLQITSDRLHLKHDDILAILCHELGRQCVHSEALRPVGNASRSLEIWAHNDQSGDCISSSLSRS